VASRRSRGEYLSQHLVEVTAEFSAVSPGTEMRLFQGRFEHGEKMDEVFSDDVFRYPMRYGYQMVGRVTRLGPSVPLSLAGRPVFVFAPHAEVAVVDHRDLVVIPTGLRTRADPRNYAFLASVETALSVAHDAQLARGGRCLVVGQGLVGMLTSAVLAMDSSVSVTVVDLNAKRLEARRRLDTCDNVRCMTPAELASWCDDEGKLFDVCVELSGSSAGLQSALDHCAYGGTCVVAAWGSSSPSDTYSVKLGSTQFHRSKVNIVSSQVSRVPGKFSDLWNKDRRKNEALKLCQRLRIWDRFGRLEEVGGGMIPEVPFETAAIQDAFLQLEQGTILSALFRYSVSPNFTRHLSRRSTNLKTSSSDSGATAPSSSRRGAERCSSDSTIASTLSRLDHHLGTNHPLTRSVAMCSEVSAASCQRLPQLLSSTVLTTKHGDFDMQVWRYFKETGQTGGPCGCTNVADEHEHSSSSYDSDPYIPHLVVLLSKGVIDETTDTLLLRVHDACFTSEAFGSVMCDCREQLALAQHMVMKNFDASFEKHDEKVLARHPRERGAGMILYTFQEGRGVGLPAKVAAYDLQQRKGLDTLEANLALGLPADAREYGFVEGIFRQLGLVNRRLPQRRDSDDKRGHLRKAAATEREGADVQIRLLTNNPRKVRCLENALGMKIASTVPLISEEVTVESRAGRYLKAKADKMEHIVQVDVARNRFQSAEHGQELVLSSSCGGHHGAHRQSPSELAEEHDHVFLSHDQRGGHGDVEAGVVLGPRSEDVEQMEARRPVEGLQPFVFVAKAWREALARHRETKPKSLLPFVTVAFASGLDGCIGVRRGGCVLDDTCGPLQISAAQSHRLTHVLRAGHDGIVVGINTVLNDNPQLNVRDVDGRFLAQLDAALRLHDDGNAVASEGERRSEAGFFIDGDAEDNVRSPVPIVLDNDLRIPLDCNIVQQLRKPDGYTSQDETTAHPKREKQVIVVYEEKDRGDDPISQAAFERRRGALESIDGVELVKVGVGAASEEDNTLEHMLNTLKERFGMQAVMVEGGARVIQSFLHTTSSSQPSFPDQIVVTVAPKFFSNTGPGEKVGLMHVGQSERSAKDVDVVMSDDFPARFGPDLVYVGKPVTNYKARQLTVTQKSHAKVLS